MLAIPKGDLKFRCAHEELMAFGVVQSRIFYKRESSFESHFTLLEGLLLTLKCQVLRFSHIPLPISLLRSIAQSSWNVLNTTV